jgi:3-carboxy-cis,cis-muconate cycloisomerase
MFDRHQQRLAQLRPARRRRRVLPAPPARSRRSATRGSRCRKLFWHEELGLGVPATTWHVARDGFAEAVNLLRARYRLARQDRADIMIMASTEFGEVYEPFVKGRGASAAPCRKSATRFPAS